MQKGKQPTKNNTAPVPKYNWDLLIGKTVKIWIIPAGHMHNCIGNIVQHRDGYLILRNVLMNRVRRETDSIPIARVHKIEEI